MINQKDPVCPCEKHPGCSLCPYAKLCDRKQYCGILSEKYRFMPDFGNGQLTHYSFDGLSVFIADLSFKQDVTAPSTYGLEVLELSYLINGERIIKIDRLGYDLVYESQESYMVYLSNISGSIHYYKERPFKEIKIRMTSDFIIKHKLAKYHAMDQQYGLHTLSKNFARPLCPRTQEILAEIVSDRQDGLPKRLFLESRALELLSLQLTHDTSKTEKNTHKDPLVKKLYAIRKIVSSDLRQSYTITQLARLTGLNDSTLKKDFKRIFGTTLFEYVMELKMTKARQLLISSDKTIYEIAEQVGYKNATHFSAAFKRIEGLSPNAYRKDTKP